MGLSEKVTLEQSPEEQRGQALALCDGAQRPFINSTRQSSGVGCPGTARECALRGRGRSTVA